MRSCAQIHAHTHRRINEQRKKEKKRSEKSVWDRRVRVTCAVLVFAFFFLLIQSLRFFFFVVFFYFPKLVRQGASFRHVAKGAYHLRDTCAAMKNKQLATHTHTHTHTKHI